MSTWFNALTLSVLGLGGSLLLSVPARADSVTVFTDPATIIETAPITPIFVERSTPRLVVPLPTIKTVQTVNTLPVVVDPAKEITTTVVEQKTTVAPKAEVKEQLILQSKASGKSDFCNRLSLMRGWIDDSRAKGLLTDDEVQAFMIEHSALVSLESEMSARGCDKAMSDELEKRLNVLNARVSNAMSGPSLAGKGLIR